MIANQNTARNTSYMLMWATVIFLLGRWYQHFFFEGPYRALFLDEKAFKWIQDVFSDQSWLDFVNNPRTDYYILIYTRILSWIWFSTAFLFALYRRVSRFVLFIFAGLSTLGLSIYAISSYLESGYQWAQGIEYAAQIATPLLCAIYLWGKVGSKWITFAKVAIALTFLGHGLFALGVFPTPGNFVYMTTQILEISDTQARELLYIAGILDIVALVLIFVPRLDRYALIYCTIWGFLTALARPAAYVLFNHLFWLSMHQSIFEFAVRLPHFILPLALFFILKKRSSVQEENARRSSSYSAV
ncbi:MAG: hypothetical protein GVX96_04835 [Bacteroidetes bacterium]|jgi:hypothetical protein|nr:hypothetical protein [Bacteroidota bacterium]